MSYQTPYKWMASFCLFHYIPTQQFKQHLRLCIYSRCLWRETPSQLHSCGWAAVAASPESQGTYKSHTKVTEIYHGQNTLNYDPTRQNKANQTIKETHVFCAGQCQESCWFVDITPLQSTAQGRNVRALLSRATVPLPQCQTPCAAFTDLLHGRHTGAAPLAPSPFLKWAQRQVKSELTWATR